jgi:hypothetical protein
VTFNLANPNGTGTDQEILDFTRAAIAQVTLHGQAYTTSGRSLTRADLPTLHKQMEIFETRVNAAAGSSRDKQNLVRLGRAS